MNFQQRYLRLSKEIKNIKDAQSKVVLDLRSVTYTSSQTMQYNHTTGEYSTINIKFCNEDGTDMTGDQVDFMSQFYCTCSSPDVYVDTTARINQADINGRHPATWATSTWTANIKIIASKKIPQIKIYNSYTGQTTIITQGTTI